MARRELVAMILGLAAGLLVACGSDAAGGGGGGDGDAVNLPENFLVRGYARVASEQGGQPTPASGATIEARVAGAAIGSAQVGGNGEFTMELVLPADSTVVVAVEQEGYASIYRTVRAVPRGEVLVTALLQPLRELACDDARCQTPGLTLEGLPAGTTGAARLFNPVTETDSFPGAFDDSDGNLLISGVFASVQLKDASGATLESLASPATLRMAIPKETWPVIVDISPGDDRITVPLFSFSGESGSWDRDGAAALVDGAGVLLPEAQLAAIRDGSFGGEVIASGDVSHFSYWNVDWPVATHGCVTAVLTTARGTPIPGATVRVQGLTYTGQSPLVATGPDGRFCADVLRSETPGEDVDNDGVTGETQRVAIYATYDGELWALGEFDLPVANAACGAGCGELGTLALSPERLLQARLCSVQGRVRLLDGTPVPDASVQLNDALFDYDRLPEICPDYSCLGIGSSDATGSFQLTTVVVAQLDAIGVLSDEPEPGRERVRMGARSFSGCPAAPIELVLDSGYDFVTVELSVVGDSISWSPSHPVSTLTVAGPTGEPKWFVMMESGSFSPPVTYGVAPAGATTVFPTDGSPAALAPGDELNVADYGSTTVGGYPLYVTGRLQLP